MKRTALLRGQPITVGFPGRKTLRESIVSQRLAVLCAAMKWNNKQRGQFIKVNLPGRLTLVS
jgi:hypothetical protein